MEELSFKTVRMHGSRDEVIARVENFLICKAAFEKALFVYPDADFGDAPGSEDHFEVERAWAKVGDGMTLSKALPSSAPRCSLPLESAPDFPCGGS
jgi:hypothetical protein